MRKYQSEIEPVLVQETHEVIGQLSDLVTDLNTRAARGDDTALEWLKFVRDQVHELVGDVKMESAKPGEVQP